MAMVTDTATDKKHKKTHKHSDKHDKHDKHVLSDDTSLILGGKQVPWSLNEAYRMLRTNLQFSLPDETNPVIGVTSAFKHDGKTTNSINIAIALGQLDKKVLLIDADLRKPSVAQKLKIKADPGFSELLAGIKPLSETLNRNGSDDNKYGIDILPGGRVPPDATMLLQSETMRKLIERFREEYDYIIIDLPPVSAVSDPVVIAPFVSGYILVVRHMQTDYRALNYTVDTIRFSNARILGSLQMTALSAPATRGSTRCRTHGRTLPKSHDQKGFGYIDQILLLQSGLCALVIKTCASFLKTGEA